MEVKTIKRLGLKKQGKLKRTTFYLIPMPPCGHLKRKMFIQWLRTEKHRKQIKKFEMSSPQNGLEETGEGGRLTPDL